MVPFVRSDTSIEIQATLREILERQIEAGPQAASARAGLKLLGDLGFLSIAVPECYGGGGQGYADLAAVSFELGRLLYCPAFVPCFVVASEILLRSGDKDACNEYLPKLSVGHTAMCLGLTEAVEEFPDVRICARATPQADGSWRLDGLKRLVICASNADYLLVPAQTDYGASIFIADLSASGSKIEARHALDQTRPVGDVRLTNVQAVLLGAPGRARELLEGALRVCTVMLASEQVGAAEFVLEKTTQYARERIQFSHPIGSFQAVQHRLANMLVELELARATSEYAAWALDLDDVDLRLATHLASVRCSEALVRVSESAIQVHAGLGFTWEHWVHRYYKRALFCQAFLGTPHRHLEALSSALGL
jgi:alkylation response protein AidB-like acyl-CoA dehydrogenase